MCSFCSLIHKELDLSQTYDKGWTKIKAGSASEPVHLSRSKEVKEKKEDVRGSFSLSILSFWQNSYGKVQKIHICLVNVHILSFVNCSVGEYTFESIIGKILQLSYAAILLAMVCSLRNVFERSVRFKYITLSLV